MSVKIYNKIQTISLLDRIENEMRVGNVWTANELKNELSELFDNTPNVCFADDKKALAPLKLRFEHIISGGRI